MKLSKIKTVAFSNLSLIIPLLLILPFYFLLYKIYIPRATAFGCFDDCFYYVGGYLLNNGKHIYSDFFFNHQLLPAFVTAIVQKVTNPQSIFELILRHRQFLLIFSLIANLILIIRFRLSAFFFVLIFELSKFYIFGDRFLGETMAIYPCVYLAGLVLEKISNRKLLAIDYFLSAIFTWFVVFTREPYFPLVLFMYGVILWNKTDFAQKKFSVILFFVLSILTVLSVNLSDYFFNVVTINKATTLTSELNLVEMPGPQILQAFFYPIYIFLFGKFNLFRTLLIGIDIIFIVEFVLLLIKKKLKPALIIFIALGLANLRVVLPGFLYYGAFHMLIWYGIFVFITCYFLFHQVNKKILLLGTLAIGLLLITFVANKDYFGKQTVDQQASLLTNYGPLIQEGSVIKALSNKSDTVFADGADELVYWQSDRLSGYKYSWYTSVMPLFPKYSNARIAMFRENPPDFYLYNGRCDNITTNSSYFIPELARNGYIQLLNDGKPSCLFVSKTKAAKITTQEWNEASTWLYTNDTTKEN